MKKMLIYDKYDNKYRDVIDVKELKEYILEKIEELDIEIQQCEYADDDIEEYKQDMENEKRILLKYKVVWKSLLTDLEVEDD